MPCFSPWRAPGHTPETTSEPIPCTAISLCMKQLAKCSSMPELRLTWSSRHISTAVLLPEPHGLLKQQQRWCCVIAALLAAGSKPLWSSMQMCTMLLLGKQVCQSTKHVPEGSKGHAAAVQSMFQAHLSLLLALLRVPGSPAHQKTAHRGQLAGPVQKFRGPAGSMRLSERTQNRCCSEGQWFCEIIFAARSA